MRTARVKLIYPAQQFRLSETPRPDGSLGLLYLAGKLRDENIGVSLLDMGVGDENDELQDTFHHRTPVDDEHVRVGMPVEKLADKIKDYNIVGVTSIFTPQTYQALEVGRYVKETRPDVLTIAGGGNARAFHELFLNNGFDIVVFGEAEDTLVDICRSFERGEGFESIPNVAFKTDGGEIRVNPERPVLRDLDRLPMPAWDMLPLDKYWIIGKPHGGTFPQGTEVRYLSMQTSRGCPFRCTYCHISKEGEAANLRFKSHERVMAEFRRIKELGAEYLFFEDDSLLAKRGRITRIFEGLGDFNLKIIGANGVNLVHFFRNVDGKPVVDEDFLKLMSRVGWVEIGFPFESGCQRILDKYASRKWSREHHDMKRLVQLAVRNGITMFGYFTFGYPDESYEEIMETVLFAQEMVEAGLHNAQFYVITPYPGSVLYDIARDNNHLPAELDLLNMKFQVPTMVNTLVPPEVFRFTRRLAYELIHSKTFVKERDSGTVSPGVAEQVGRLSNVV